MSLTRELTGATKQTVGRRAVTEVGSSFFLPGGERLLPCWVKAKNQTQVGLALGITAGPCLFWSGRGIEEPLITSISSLKMVKK